MRIEEKFPELSKYIAEIPVTVSDLPGREIRSSNLKEYYDSLDAFLKKYAAYRGSKHQIIARDHFSEALVLI